MSRNGVGVRDAVPSDLPLLVEMTRAALDRDGRTHTGLKPFLTPGSTMSELDFEAVLRDPEVRVIVAVGGDGQPCGFAILAEDQVSPLIGRAAVNVSYLIVPPARRNRGVGKALLTEIAQFAEQIEAENVIVGVSSDSREINRYYARFGFAPLIVRRIASVPTLRRTLGMAEPVVSRTEARRRAVLARFSPGRARGGALSDSQAR